MFVKMTNLKETLSWFLIVIFSRLANVSSQNRLFWLGLELDNASLTNDKVLPPQFFTCKKDYEKTIPIELRPVLSTGISLWSTALDRSLFLEDSEIWRKLSKSERDDAVKMIQSWFVPTILVIFFVLAFVSIPIAFVICKLVTVITFLCWNMFTNKWIRKLGRAFIIKLELLRRQNERESSLQKSSNRRKRRFTMPTFFRSNPHEAIPLPLKQIPPPTFYVAPHEGFNHLRKRRKKIKKQSQDVKTTSFHEVKDSVQFIMQHPVGVLENQETGLDVLEDTD